MGFVGGSDGEESVWGRGSWVWFLAQEGPLEKGMAPYFSILAWETPWTEEVPPWCIHSYVGAPPIIQETLENKIWDWEGNKQEGQGSPNRGNRLWVADIFISFKRQEEQTRDIFSSLYKFKFLLKYCVVMTPGLTWSWLFPNLELTNTFFLWKCLS